MRGRVDGNVLQGVRSLARDGRKLRNALDFIAKVFHPDGQLLHVGGHDFHNIAAHAEGGAAKGDIVARKLDFHQPAQQLVQRQRHARAQRNHLPGVFAGIAHGIDAADRRHNNHIPALLQGGGGAVAQAVNFIVDRRILFNVGIGGCDVSFRLVIIVVGYKVFHRAVGEKRFEFRAQLGGQRFIVGDYQRWALHALDDRGHGKRLARACYAQQRLRLEPLFKALRQGGDGLRLITPCDVGRF